MQTQPTPSDTPTLAEMAAYRRMQDQMDEALLRMGAIVRPTDSPAQAPSASSGSTTAAQPAQASTAPGTAPV